jgi:exopolysaccharide biosynthesis polyprenyl glycosylphosphotransferase
MSSQLHETTVDALPVGDVAQPLLQSAHGIRLSRRTASLVALAGRYGVIWLPVYALLSSHMATVTDALGASLVVATIWLLALHAAFAAGRLTMLALGPFVAAAVGTAVGLVLVSALNMWSPVKHLDPKTLLEMAGGVFILSACWESVVLQSVAAVRRVLIVGARDGGSELVEDLSLAQRLPFELIGVVDDERETDQVAGAPVHGRIADLPRIIDAQRPDLVVLAVGQNRPEAFGYLLDAAGAGFKVVGLPEFYEHAFGRVPVRTVSVSWFMSVLHLYQRPYSRLAKRTFDVVVAVIGLVLTSWLFPLLALLVRRTPGPVIYRQTRLGEGGRHFTILKFRTMRVDAEAAGAPVWASERDPRVTGVGRFMRTTRLDELPQLWNVLRGDMSVVGPRPERPEFLEQLQEELPFWSRRHLVKPGITGWAQVRRGYTADAEGTGEKLSYDLWYLRHRSLVVDLAVCAKTFTTLLTGSGAR